MPLSPTTAPLSTELLTICEDAFDTLGEDAYPYLYMKRAIQAVTFYMFVIFGLIKLVEVPLDISPS
jgi:hypothetical protein